MHRRAQADGGALMAFDQGLVDWVEEAMAPLGAVTLRKMMGGATLYLDGTIFAIVDDDQLWFKADVESDAAWDAAGCPRFTMTFKDGKVDTMNYRRAPDDVYDDADALRQWASLGFAAGRRAPVKKKAREEVDSSAFARR
jgi:DNA transformation protein and related proteins